MHFKFLFIAALFLTSICNASMHHQEKHVNRRIQVCLDDIEFKKDGMYLTQSNGDSIRISQLTNEDNNYFAFIMIDYVCGNCHKVYSYNPGVCEVCGSSNIHERERDLWPTG